MAATSARGRTCAASTWRGRRRPRCSRPRRARHRVGGRQLVDAHPLLVESMKAMLGSEFIVNSVLNGTQSSPDIAIDADGDFVVTWLEDVATLTPGEELVVPERGHGREPVPFEVYEEGVFLHGTKADLAVGDEQGPHKAPSAKRKARRSNFHSAMTISSDNSSFPNSSVRRSSAESVRASSSAPTARF